MYTEKDFEIIKKTIIQDVPGTVGIILFGSYANGTANKKSDMDIMILLEKEFDWRKRHSILNRIYQDTGKKGYIIDFILKTKLKYDNDKILPSISRVIANEGKVLWMKN